VFQGYFYGKPMTAAQLEQLIQAGGLPLHRPEKNPSADSLPA
jgi:hypothetical protein